ncbi:hypothetical protein H0H92_011267 [Tricholoma furcatifolium]|nr:hypothetical protein H0H92_011267 [Tricholoma furcatifolium]
MLTTNVQGEMAIAIAEYHGRSEHSVTGNSGGSSLHGMTNGDDEDKGESSDSDTVNSYDSDTASDSDDGTIGESDDDDDDMLSCSSNDDDDMLSCSSDDNTTTSSGLWEVPVEIPVTAHRLALRSATHLSGRMEATSPEKDRNIYRKENRKPAKPGFEDTTDEEPGWPRKALTISWLEDSKAALMFEALKKRP